MASDASIYGLIKPYDPGPGPLELYGKAAQVRNLMGQGQIQDLQTQKLSTDLSEEQAVKELFRKYPDGKVPIAELMGASPERGLKFQKTALDIQKTQGDIGKTALESQALQVKLIRDIAAQVSGDADMPAAREAVARVVGPDKAAQLPFFNTPFTPENKLRAITTADEHFKQLEAQRGRDIQLTTQAETARHHRALEGDPEVVESTAQAIAKGDLAPLSGFALARPMGQNIMSRVIAINPQFDPTQFAVRQKAEKDFATGKPGNTVRSFNVALSHLDTLDTLADALNNKDTRLINVIGNKISVQTGSSAPTNFEAAKKIVGDEIVKAIVGSGGGVTDRQEAASAISSASSPAQLKGVIKTYKELMKGQLGGLRDQYKATTGKDDFDTKYLSEAARNVAKTTAEKAGGGVSASSLSNDELLRELSK